MKLYLRLLSLSLFILFSGPAFAQSEPGICAGIYNSALNLAKNILGPIKRSWQCRDCSHIRTRCDLSTLEPIPKVLVIGEKHDSESSLAIQKAVFSRSAKTGMPVATEIVDGAPALPWTGKELFLKNRFKAVSSPHIHTIESPALSGLLTSYDIQRDALFYGVRRSSLVQISANIITNPLFRGAYEKLRDRPDFKKLLSRLDPMHKKFKQEGESNLADFPKSVHNIESILKDFPPDVLKKFMNELHIQIVNLTHSEFPEDVNGFEKEYLLSKTDLERLGNLEPDKPLPGSYLNRVEREPRDRYFTGKIGDLLCDYSKKSKLLTVIVGDAHVDGVLLRLKAMSNDKVAITYLRSYVDSEAKEIQKLLK